MSSTARTSRLATASLGFLLIVSMMLVAPSAANAAPLTAADFAADCNDDGELYVSGTQRYRTGTAVITGDCSIVHAPGAKLVLKNVDLQVTGNLVAISSLNDATIKVVDSTINAAGYLELTAGCCGGEFPEYNGTVIVKRSSLTGLAIQLMASFDLADGTVIIRESQLNATGDLGIQIRASDLNGTSGNIRLIDTQLSSAGDVQVSTGTDGRTVVRRNNFSATGVVTISTGAGGSCVSTGNTPTVTCS